MTGTAECLTCGWSAVGEGVNIEAELHDMNNPTHEVVFHMWVTESDD